MQGYYNRVGHNWESAADWLISNFTTGVKFRTQSHRTTMEEKRITVHFLKPVGRGRQSAELDRVWEQDTDPHSAKIVYVLEAKWGLCERKLLMTATTCFGGQATSTTSVALLTAMPIKACFEGREFVDAVTCHTN